MATFVNWDSVTSALTEKVGRESEGGWVLVHYTDSDTSQPHTIGYLGSGTGGVDELKKLLQEDKFYYGLIRLANPKELEHSNKTTYRDIFFAVQGPKLSIMKRGRLVEHLGAVQSKFEPNHAQLIVKNIGLLSKQELILKSDPKAGSHLIE